MKIRIKRTPSPNNDMGCRYYVQYQPGLFFWKTYDYYYSYSVALAKAKQVKEEPEYTYL